MPLHHQASLIANSAPNLSCLCLPSFSRQHDLRVLSLDCRPAPELHRPSLPFCYDQLNLLHRSPIHHQASPFSVCLLSHADMISEFCHLTVAQHPSFTTRLCPSATTNSACSIDCRFTTKTIRLPIHCQASPFSVYLLSHANTISEFCHLTVAQHQSFTTHLYPSATTNSACSIDHRLTATPLLSPSVFFFHPDTISEFYHLTIAAQHQSFTAHLCPSATTNSACSINCRFTAKPL